MTAPVRLEGNFVKLEPLRLDHTDRLCLIGLDPRLWHATTVKIQTREEMESYVRAAINAQLTGTALPFVIVDRGSGDIVGTTRYHSAVPEHKRVEIGLTWIAPPWQRTMINTESKYLMLRHAFETLDCVRVEFKANATNEQSRRALLRIGAKPEGTLRSYRVAPTGETFDLVVFSIIATEWPQVRLSLESMMANKSTAAV